MNNTGKPWVECEVRAATKAYFELLDAQLRGEPINKRELYRRLSGMYPDRSPKSFESKFQNISAILYEEKHPYVLGLRPRDNYQHFLKLMVLDHLGRLGPSGQMPKDILLWRLTQLNRRGFLPVRGAGSGRYGLTLEHYLDIPPNSSRDADFMGIELKTKRGCTLQTLFSRTPSRFTGCRDPKDLVRRFGRDHGPSGKRRLYTSFDGQPDSFGFTLRASCDVVTVENRGASIMEYEPEALESALLTKHTETAFVKVTDGRTADSAPACRFDEMRYCKWPSVLRFLKLINAGKVYLDLLLSAADERVKSHGFLWRIKPDSLPDLYLHSQTVDLRQHGLGMN